MNKNTEYLLGGILILVFAFALFNFNVTGLVTNNGKITVTLTDGDGNPKTVFERGNILKVTIDVSKGKEVMNRYVSINRDNAVRNRVGGTTRLVCGKGNACGEGTYVIKYRIEDTVKKFEDGNYFIRIEEHILPRFRDDINDHVYIYEPFAIEGPNLCPQVEGVYKC